MLEIARLLFTQSTNPSVMRPYKQFLQHALLVTGLLAFLSPTTTFAKVVVVPLGGKDAVKSTYQQSAAFDYGPQDILTQNEPGIPIGSAVVFNKQHNHTSLEAEFHGQAIISSLSQEVSNPFVRFSLLANGETATFSTSAALTNSRNEDHISLVSIFQGLPKGQYTIRVYAYTNSIGLDLVVGPSELGGRIIVKEVD